MQHTPVLLHEVIKFLDPQPGKRFIDATLGMGGHSEALLAAGAEVLGIDWDPRAVEAISAKLKFQYPKLKTIHGSFANLKGIAEENRFVGPDGILMDLGFGSHQLDNPERGLSFQKEGPLDMRYDTEAPSERGKAYNAGEIVNYYSEKDLLKIFWEYGEERRFGKRIARAILQSRKSGSLTTTTQLFELIKAAVPGKFRFKASDTARRIFQALRIAVNDELHNIEKGLQQAVDILSPGGRLVVISFHSLEDRIVKKYFVQQARDCTCPPAFPLCVCSAKARLRILTKKPVSAEAEEIKTNPRSKSAHLRVAEKIAN